jgi:hypothetical protein
MTAIGHIFCAVVGAGVLGKGAFPSFNHFSSCKLPAAGQPFWQAAPPPPTPPTHTHTHTTHTHTHTSRSTPARPPPSPAPIILHILPIPIQHPLPCHFFI